MKQNKIEISNMFRETGIFILLFIVNVIALTSILFFVKVSISVFHIPVSLALTIIEFYFIYRKKASIIQMCISIVISILIFVISILIAGNTYDMTWDGNTYHKTAVGSLKNGWNPVYEKVEDFNIEDGNEINIDNEEDNKLWVNHYPKASWIFAANVYKLTDNIEMAKVLNLLMICACFGIIATYLSKKINRVWGIILALLIVVNPITVPQVFNYYIDGILGLSLFMILCSLIEITDIKYGTHKDEENEKFDLKEHFIVLALAIIFIINLKFTGIVYAGIFCLLFYVYWLYKENKQGNFKQAIIKYTSFFAAVVIFSVVVVGFSSYVKNTFENGHPFYPLFGENKVDIITHNQPAYFKERGVFRKFFITMFSEGSNVHDSYGDNNDKPHLKIPFTITDGEINEYARPDTRISGFGPLYSGIFIISCLCTIYMFYRMWRDRNFNVLIPFILILLGMFILVLATDGSWWARYTPYLYLLPIFNLIYLIKRNNKFSLTVGIILLILLIVNLSLIIYANCSSHLKQYGGIDNAFERFETYVNNHDEIDVMLKTTGFEGIKYNISDLDIELDKINYVENLEKPTRNVYFFAYHEE